jgi:hypothetical protein
MLRKFASGSILCGALIFSGLLAAWQPADAGPVRVRFTPDYGPPFSDLYWEGDAVIDDGECTATGTVWNFGSPCGGEFSFISATVRFYNTVDKSDILQTLNFDPESAQVINVQRTSPEPPGWKQVVSTPFNPIQAANDVDEAHFNGKPAFFSLVLVGGSAQLFWFEKNPGPFGDPWWNVLIYKACYLIGPGSEQHCGLSESDVPGGNGASFSAFESAEIPEPGTMALVLAAGLGALGLKSRRRNV